MAAGMQTHEAGGNSEGETLVMKPRTDWQWPPQETTNELGAIIQNPG